MSTNQINNFINTNVSNIILNDEINIQNTLEDEIDFEDFDLSDSILSDASTVIF